MSDETPHGATPLSDDEAEDLIPDYIGTHGELNAWEQRNILKAAEWVESARTPALNESTIRELHRRMFDETWRWAGRYRQSDKTIGTYWAHITDDLVQLLGNGSYWIENSTYEIDEIALRLHHRLVKIHPFPNGNGRHARLWCDLLLRQNGRHPFEWRGADLDENGEARTLYIRALRAADDENYAPLLTLYLTDR